jgi:hypothetical protein
MDTVWDVCRHTHFEIPLGTGAQTLRTHRDDCRSDGRALRQRARDGARRTATAVCVHRATHRGRVGCSYTSTWTITCFSSGRRPERSRAGSKARRPVQHDSWRTSRTRVTAVTHAKVECAVAGHGVAREAAALRRRQGAELRVDAGYETARNEIVPLASRDRVTVSLTIRPDWPGNTAVRALEPRLRLDACSVELVAK